jgi:hypothetical protein
MALVASATLWITGELAPWVAPVQIVCLGLSYLTRDDPPSWRMSPVWLNVGMFAITGVTIERALAGDPAPLSLAHFAALSQGLQLMDARPRKSEFLLVALALFQVILAANLTDSLFFPPLLVVFLVSVTWTLMVHTLRTEAAEAGDALAASQAISPALRRNTFVATCMSILLALILFTALPRMRGNMLRGGLGAGMAMAGFSNQISLGTIGRIRQDNTVVLRIETLEGSPPPRTEAYWRGLAFDHFDGRSWAISVSPAQSARAHVSGSPRFGVDLSGGPGAEPLVQRIVREPVEAGVLFGAGLIRRIEGPLDYLEMDHNGGLYLPSRPTIAFATRSGPITAAGTTKRWAKSDPRRRVKSVRWPSSAQSATWLYPNSIRQSPLWRVSGQKASTPMPSERVPSNDRSANAADIPTLRPTWVRRGPLPSRIFCRASSPDTASTLRVRWSC